MTATPLLDPLFLVPFLNGLLLAAVLPVLGTYARLRGEWLASLAIGQAAAAGVVLGAFLGVPVVATATVLAIVAALGKTAFGRSDGADVYAVILLAGWSAALLLAANTAHGDDLSRALLQGQIYLTGRAHLAALAAVGVGVAVGLPAISRQLLLGRFFPEYYLANGIGNPRHDVVFDLVMATVLAIAAAVVGVMAALALVFVPPWVAFAWAHGWRRTVAWAAALGVAAHGAAFVLAIAFDQPYGPVLVAVLLAMSAARALRASRRAWPPPTGRRLDTTAGARGRCDDAAP